MIRKYKVVDILDGRLILAQNTDSLEKVVFKVLQKSAGRPYTSSEYSYHGDRRYFNVISVFCCNIRQTIYYHKGSPQAQAKLELILWMMGGIYLYTSEKIIEMYFVLAVFKKSKTSLLPINITFMVGLLKYFETGQELLNKFLTRVRNCWISV